MKIGFRMKMVLDEVSKRPGQYRSYVAQKIGPNGSHYYGYQAVQRAIKAGLVKAADVTKPRKGKILYV